MGWSRNASRIRPARSVVVKMRPHAARRRIAPASTLPPAPRGSHLGRSHRQVRPAVVLAPAHGVRGDIFLRRLATTRPSSWALIRAASTGSDGVPIGRFIIVRSTHDDDDAATTPRSQRGVVKIARDPALGRSASALNNPQT